MITALSLSRASFGDAPFSAPSGGLRAIWVSDRFRLGGVTLLFPRSQYGTVFGGCGGVGRSFGCCRPVRFFLALPAVAPVRRGGVLAFSFVSFLPRRTSSFHGLVALAS